MHKKRSMFNSEYRSHWHADDPQKEFQLLKLLQTEDLGFGALLTRLKSSRQALTEYLKSLEKNILPKRETGGEQATPWFVTMRA